jgi:hypothetical protein
MTRVIRGWHAGSCVALSFLALALWLVLLGGVLRGGITEAGLGLVVGTGATAGVMLGFFSARRIWRKCGTARAFRRKPTVWYLAITTLAITFQVFLTRFVPPGIGIPASLCLLGGLGTASFGFALFERTSGYRLWFGRIPPVGKAQWIEVRAERFLRNDAR